MTLADQRLIGVVLILCAFGSVLLVAAVHRLGQRRPRIGPPPAPADDFALWDGEVGT